MREPNRVVQALRDKVSTPDSANRKPSPPPKREVDKGVFVYRELKPAKTQESA